MIENVFKVYQAIHDYSIKSVTMFILFLIKGVFLHISYALKKIVWFINIMIHEGRVTFLSNCSSKAMGPKRHELVLH